MTHLLLPDEEEGMEKINMDELFEKNHNKDLKQLSLFKKLLNRIHNRIKVTSRTKRDQHIFFTVPEYIFGQPLYDKGDCIGYLVVKLEENGFHTKYIHPATLFVSWNHHVPGYVRTQFKKQTGKVIDQKGNIIKRDDDEDPEEELFNRGKPKNINNNSKQKDYKEINNYKPSGNLVYDQDLFDKIDKKINKLN
jgi:hypothetical protein